MAWRFNKRTINFNGGTIQARANNAAFLAGSLAGGVNAGGAIFDTNGFNVTVSSPLIHHASLGATPDGGLTKNGAGILTLTAANSYTGTTTVSGGTLNFAGAGTTSTASAITVQNGGTLRFSRNDTWGNAGTLNTAPITIDAGGVVESNNSFNALVGLTLNGGTLSANGGVNANFPTFGLKGTVTVNATAGGSFISTTGAGDFNTVAIGTGGAGGITTFAVADGAAASDLTVSAPLSNLAGAASGLTKTGDGTMTLTAANSYTGTTTVAGGTLQIAMAGALNNTGNVNTTGGGTLDISGALTMGTNTYFAVGNGIAGTTGTAVLNSGANVNLGGNAVLIGGNRPAGVGGAGSGVGTLTINGGTLTVAAASGTGGGTDTANIWLNPYGTAGTSVLNLNGGVLSTARAIADGGGGNSLVNFNGGTLQAGANLSILVNNIAVNVRNGGAIIDTQNFNVTIARPLAHSNIGGDNAIDGGLTKNGAGILTLTSAGSTFNGDVTVNAGTLSLAAGFNNPNPVNSAIGNATVARTVTIESGAVLEFAANDVMGNAAALPQVTLVINEGGTVRSNGTKFSTLGALQLNGGTLSANNGVNASFQTWSLTDTVTVGGSAASTISTTGSNAGIHLGSSANNIITFDVADVTGSAATDLLVSAPLINRNAGQGGGAGGLTKAGAGTMNLTAASSYSGGTLVSGGTLLVNNTIDSGTGTGPVMVSTGATLGGSGIIAGDTTISGTHSPGNSPGIITHGNLSYASGANVLWELTDNTNLGRGVNFDGINVTGDLNFAGPTALDLVFNLSGSSVDWSDQSFWSNNFFGTDGWLLYDVSGTTSNFGNLSINSINWADGMGGLFDSAPWGKNFGLHLDGNDIYLTYTPEPTKSVLLALGLLGLLARRRR